MHEKFFGTENSLILKAIKTYPPWGIRLRYYVVVKTDA